MSIYDGIKDFLGLGYGKIPETDHNEVAVEELEPKQIALARKWHGSHEVVDIRKLKALLGFDPVTTAWCAGFVNAIEKQCGRPGTGKLNARSYLNYGLPVDVPKIGDIVIFKRGKLPWQGHVGYYISQNNEGILVLGGNQNNKVCYKYYPKDAVLGFRRP